MTKSRRILQDPRMLLGLLLLASVLLVVGICLPIMTIKTLVFMRHSFSVLSGIVDLLVGGKWLLFVLVLVFSVIFPVAKLSFLFALVLGRLKHNATTERTLKLLHDYGRWAMLDVFVVALLIVSIKLGSIANVQVHYGLYVFCAAVLLIMWVTHLIVKMLKQARVG